MAKKSVELQNINELYGTGVTGPLFKSNHPIKSKVFAAVLALVPALFMLAAVVSAMITGARAQGWAMLIIGILLSVHYFYLRNIVRGIIILVLAVVFAFVIIFSLWDSPVLMLILALFTALKGVLYLISSPAGFRKKNHVRTI